MVRSATGLTCIEYLGNIGLGIGVLGASIDYEHLITSCRAFSDLAGNRTSVRISVGLPDGTGAATISFC